MPASADTVLRLIRNLPLPEPEPPRVVGVDDWALRKGRTYGSIVVDLERRRVLDLLPDRTAETLADWLRGQPQIAVVARDRSTEYARGIGLGAPGRRKWLTAGMCWSTCARRSSDGWPGRRRGCGACRPVPARPPTRNRAADQTLCAHPSREGGPGRPPGAMGGALRGSQAAARRR